MVARNPCARFKVSRRCDGVPGAHRESRDLGVATAGLQPMRISAGKTTQRAVFSRGERAAVNVCVGSTERLSPSPPVEKVPSCQNQQQQTS